MIGLRKVVKLFIHDIPEEKVVINRKKGINKSFRYSWRNYYYLGDKNIHKSPLYSSYRKPFYIKECDDKLLGKITSKVTKGDSNILDNLDEYTDRIFYMNNDSYIFYEGDKIEEVKRKILTRRMK